jgi:diaminohydroxyphosphoribosylaminopyrimidine deaminase/5-amino-6-(5-phosphoribosylamino)uracil reductase
LSTPLAEDFTFMRRALRLAARGYGQTSPNPMVGAVLVKHGKIIGQGWHRRAGAPHAEIEALRDSARRGHDSRDATLYVTLEPCCTHGRTPPCTDALVSAGVKKVIVGATDPNPRNESFNHWIVHRTPFVTMKAAMTLDGKIATHTGESKWITGKKARAFGMKLRQGADAILVGVNTVLADDPALTLRSVEGCKLKVAGLRQPRRIVLDSGARTPLSAQLVTDHLAALTTTVVSEQAPKKRTAALRKRVRVEVAPLRDGVIDLRWLVKKLGAENVTSVLVEGGGEVNASFLFSGLAHRIAFFYAPKIIGGRDAPKAVAGTGISDVKDALSLDDVEYRWLGEDLLMSARIEK